MKNYSLILMVLVLITGCSISRKCEDILCITPPPSFTFEIVDAETEENLFTNGTLNVDDIQLRDEDNRPVDWTFISENNLDVINLGIGWEPGFNSYQLILRPNLEIPIRFHSEKKTANCCTFYEITEFSLSSYAYEQSPTTGFLRIYIE